MAKENMCVQGEGLLMMSVEGRLHGETEHFLKPTWHIHRNNPNHIHVHGFKLEHDLPLPS